MLIRPKQTDDRELSDSQHSSLGSCGHERSGSRRRGWLAQNRSRSERKLLIELLATRSLLSVDMLVADCGPNAQSNNETHAIRSLPRLPDAEAPRRTRELRGEGEERAFTSLPPRRVDESPFHPLLSARSRVEPPRQHDPQSLVDSGESRHRVAFPRPSAPVIFVASNSPDRPMQVDAIHAIPALVTSSADEVRVVLDAPRDAAPLRQPPPVAAPRPVIELLGSRSGGPPQSLAREGSSTVQSAAGVSHDSYAAVPQLEVRSPESGVPRSSDTLSLATSGEHRDSATASFFAPQGTKLRLPQSDNAARHLDRLASDVADDLRRQRELSGSVRELNVLLDLLLQDRLQHEAANSPPMRRPWDGARTSSGTRGAAIVATSDLPFAGMIAVWWQADEITREPLAVASDQVAAWTNRIGLNRSYEIPRERSLNEESLAQLTSSVPRLRDELGMRESASAIGWRPLIASVGAVAGGVFVAATRWRAQRQRLREQNQPL